tara:strand:+ start:493 stop:858 length:366 start_codon:yes stop_codon:yes gene_type:complete
MIRLSPTTNAQSVSIIPRAYTVAANLSMVIVQDGTRETQTINNITSSLSTNGNFLQMSIAFSILTAETSYSFELKQGATLLYRGKAYCTSQTDNTTDHTLNSNKYNQYVGTDTDDQKYIIL